MKSPRDVPLWVEALAKWGQTGTPAIISRRPLCVRFEETEEWVTQIIPSVCQELQKYREKLQTFKDAHSKSNTPMTTSLRLLGLTPQKKKTLLLASE